MSEAFIAIVNMSISASWIIAAVLIVRLLLKKAPKWISVMLWGIVGVRLACPFTIESALSLIPSAHTVSYETMTDKSPEINFGISFINDILNPVISDSLSAALADSANPMQILLPVLVGVWLAGMAAMLIYAAVSYILLKKRVANALPIRDNVFSGENVASPFVLGIIKPKIYLPVNISERNAEKVILHEEAHIRRRDHIIKPIGFLLLCVYWFNPLVWLGYILLCKDIELACDERAVRNFSSDQLADYSQALLSCSVNRRIITDCPIAFGEVSVKSRDKSVLHYKKPAFWVVVAAIVASIVVAVCFLTSPKTDDIVASDGEPGTASSNYAINLNLYEKNSAFPDRRQNRKENTLLQRPIKRRWTASGPSTTVNTNTASKSPVDWERTPKTPPLSCLATKNKFSSVIPGRHSVSAAIPPPILTRMRPSLSGTGYFKLILIRIRFRRKKERANLASRQRPPVLTLP